MGLKKELEAEKGSEEDGQGRRGGPLLLTLSNVRFRREKFRSQMLLETPWKANFCAAYSHAGPRQCCHFWQESCY